MEVELHTQENVLVTENLTEDQEEILWSEHHEKLLIQNYFLNNNLTVLNTPIEMGM